MLIDELTPEAIAAIGREDGAPAVGAPPAPAPPRRRLTLEDLTPETIAAIGKPAEIPDEMAPSHNQEGTYSDTYPLPVEPPYQGRPSEGFLSDTLRDVGAGVMNIPRMAVAAAKTFQSEEDVKAELAAEAAGKDPGWRARTINNIDSLSAPGGDLEPSADQASGGRRIASQVLRQGIPVVGAAVTGAMLPLPAAGAGALARVGTAAVRALPGSVGFGLQTHADEFKEGVKQGIAHPRAEAVTEGVIEALFEEASGLLTFGAFSKTLRPGAAKFLKSFRSASPEARAAMAKGAGSFESWLTRNTLPGKMAVAWDMMKTAGGEAASENLTAEAQYQTKRIFGKKAERPDHGEIFLTSAIIGAGLSGVTAHQGAKQRQAVVDALTDAKADHAQRLAAASAVAGELNRSGLKAEAATLYTDWENRINAGQPIDLKQERQDESDPDHQISSPAALAGRAGQYRDELGAARVRAPEPIPGADVPASTSKEDRLAFLKRAVAAAGAEFTDVVPGEKLRKDQAALRRRYEDAGIDAIFFTGKGPLPAISGGADTIFLPAGLTSDLAEKAAHEVGHGLDARPELKPLTSVTRQEVARALPEDTYAASRHQLGYDRAAAGLEAATPERAFDELAQDIRGELYPLRGRTAEETKANVEAWVAERAEGAPGRWQRAKESLRLYAAAAGLPVDIPDARRGTTEQWTRVAEAALGELGAAVDKGRKTVGGRLVADLAEIRGRFPTAPRAEGAPELRVRDVVTPSGEYSKRAAAKRQARNEGGDGFKQWEMVRHRTAPGEYQVVEVLDGGERLKVRKGTRPGSPVMTVPKSAMVRGDSPREVEPPAAKTTEKRPLFKPREGAPESRRELEKRAFDLGMFDVSDMSDYDLQEAVRVTIADRKLEEAAGKRRMFKERPAGDAAAAPAKPPSTPKEAPRPAPPAPPPAPTPRPAPASAPAPAPGPAGATLEAGDTVTYFHPNDGKRYKGKVVSSYVDADGNPSVTVDTWGTKSPTPFRADEVDLAEKGKPPAAAYSPAPPVAEQDYTEDQIEEFKQQEREQYEREARGESGFISLQNDLRRRGGFNLRDEKQKAEFRAVFAKRKTMPGIVSSKARMSADAMAHALGFDSAESMWFAIRDEMDTKRPQYNPSWESNPPEGGVNVAFSLPSKRPLFKSKEDGPRLFDTQAQLPTGKIEPTVAQRPVNVGLFDRQKPDDQLDLFGKVEAKFSLETYRRPAWSKKLRSSALAAGYSDNVVDNVLQTLEAAAQLFENNSVLSAYARGARGKGSAPIKPNADFVKTLDINRLCRRTQKYYATLRGIQEQVGHLLSPDEMISLAQEMRAAGDISFCTFCYVEAGRRMRRSLEKLFLEAGVEDIPAGRLQSLRALIPQRDKLMADLGITKAEFQRAVSSAARTREFVDQYGDGGKRLLEMFDKYALGAKGTLILPNGTYGHQILRWSQEAVKEFNSRAGLRMFSATDIDPTQIMDLNQAFADAMVKGLAAHAYSKDAYAALIYGRTGLKINISIAADGRKGFKPDTFNGMDWDLAKRLRQEYPDTGTIFVAKNQDQLDWALRQDWIDYVIPHHAAAWGDGGARRYTALDLEELAAGQRETWVDTTGRPPSKKASKNYRTGEMVHFIASPKEIYGSQLWFSGFLQRAGNNEAQAVRDYLDFCDKNGIVPRFDRYRNHPGYIKLLKDYARTDSPQRPLDATKIDRARMGEYLQAFVDRGGFTGDQTVDPAFVEEFVGKMKDGRVGTVEAIEAREKELATARPTAREAQTVRKLFPSRKGQGEAKFSLPGARDIWSSLSRLDQDLAAVGRDFPIDDVQTRSPYVPRNLSPTGTLEFLWKAFVEKQWNRSITTIDGSFVDLLEPDHVRRGGYLDKDPQKQRLWHEITDEDGRIQWDKVETLLMVPSTIDGGAFRLMDRQASNGYRMYARRYKSHPDQIHVVVVDPHGYVAKQKSFERLGGVVTQMPKRMVKDRIVGAAAKYVVDFDRDEAVREKRLTQPPGAAPPATRGVSPLEASTPRQAESTPALGARQEPEPGEAKKSLPRPPGAARPAKNNPAGARRLDAAWRARGLNVFRAAEHAVKYWPAGGKPAEDTLSKTPEGREYLQRVERAWWETRRRIAYWGKDMNAARRGLDKADRIYIRDHFLKDYEQGGVGRRWRSPAVAAFARAWEKANATIAEEAGPLVESFKGRESGTYVPHRLTDKAREILQQQNGPEWDALREAAKVNGIDITVLLGLRQDALRQSKYGSIDYARIADLPWTIRVGGQDVKILETDPEILFAHIRNAARRLSTIEEFGADEATQEYHDQVAGGLVSSGTDTDATKEALARIWLRLEGQDAKAGATLNRMTHGAWQAADSIVAALNLSGAVIGNLVGGHLPESVRMGFGPTMRAFKDAYTTSLASKDLAELHALVDLEGDLLHELASTETLEGRVAAGAGKFLAATGFVAVNRRINFAVARAMQRTHMKLMLDRVRTGKKTGKLWGKDAGAARRYLTEELRFSEDDIQRMTLEGPTDADMARAIGKELELVNAMNESPGGRPAFVANPLWRMAFAYSTFVRKMYDTTKFAAREAKAGNVRPLATLLVAGTLTAEIMRAVKDALKDREEEKKGFIDKLAGEMTEVGALGMAGSFAFAIRRMDDPNADFFSDAFKPPHFATLGAVGKGLIESGQNISLRPLWKRTAQVASGLDIIDKQATKRGLFGSRYRNRDAAERLVNKVYLADRKLQDGTVRAALDPIPSKHKENTSRMLVDRLRQSMTDEQILELIRDIKANREGEER